MLISYLREIWHFKPKRLLHQGFVNGSIANFFAILLQYNSKHRIVLFTVLQKKNLYFTSPISPEISLSSLSFFLLSSLSSFSVSPSTLSFLKLHRRNFSPISKISHPSHTTSLSSLIARPLSHCTSTRFWIFEVGGWISVDRRAGFGSLGWDRLIDGFEMVDLLIGGWIVWVDCR